MGKVSSYTPVTVVEDADRFYLAKDDGAGGFTDQTLEGDVAKRQFGAAGNVTTTDPGVGDDDADGYRAGSLWLNTTDGGLFVCEDASTGAAVWTEVTSVGASGVTINTQTGTSYTLVLSDADKLVTLSNGSAITLTVPTNASVAFPVGTVIGCAQLGAGLVTIAGDTGVTINGVTPGDEDSNGQYATWSLTKLATDTWLASGGLA